MRLEAVRIPPPLRGFEAGDAERRGGERLDDRAADAARAAGDDRGGQGQRRAARARSSQPSPADVPALGRYSHPTQPS